MSTKKKAIIDRLENGTAAEANAALDPVLGETVQPYVRIEARPKSELPLWTSKACDGRPYLPKRMAWPSDRNVSLLPVLQIDLADVPALASFPRTGMISLWWSEDYAARKLLYFPEIEREDTKLWSDFSKVGGAQLYPYRRSVALEFSRQQGCVCLGDYRFEKLIGGTDVLDALFDSPHYTAVADHIWKKSGGGDSRIGGWANPQQEDPRVQKRLAGYETQLLQIENDNFTHNVFIKPAALKKADFSDLLFYEACD